MYVCPSTNLLRTNIRNYTTQFLRNYGVFMTICNYKTPFLHLRNVTFLLQCTIHCLLYHNSVENFVTTLKQECNVHYIEQNN